MDVAVNLFGLLGVVLLAAPAFYAAKYGLLAARLRSIGPIVPTDQRLVEIHQNALDQLTEHQSRWSATLSNCLVGGTFSSGISYLLGLVKALAS